VCVIVSGSRIKPEKQRRVIPDWSSHTLQDSNLRSHASITLFSSFSFRERERNTRHLSAQGGIIEPNVCVLWSRAHTHTHSIGHLYCEDTNNVWRKFGTLTLSLSLSLSLSLREIRGWNKNKSWNHTWGGGLLNLDRSDARRAAGARSPVTGESTGVQVCRWEEFFRDC